MVICLRILGDPLLGDLLCANGTVNVYLVRPFTALREYHGLILADLYHTGRYSAVAELAVDPYLELAYCDRRNIRLMMRKDTLVSDGSADDDIIGHAVKDHAVGSDYL